MGRDQAWNNYLKFHQKPKRNIGYKQSPDHDKNSRKTLYPAMKPYITRWPPWELSFSKAVLTLSHPDTATITVSNLPNYLSNKKGKFFAFGPIMTNHDNFLRPIVS